MRRMQKRLSPNKFHNRRTRFETPFIGYRRSTRVRERKISQLQKWMTQRGFGIWGIKTGPYAAHEVTFAPIFLQIFHFHTGDPFLITPEGQ